MEQNILREKIASKKWFQRTSSKIQTQILECGNEGLLNSLSKIADEYDFGEVLEITDFWTKEKISGGNFKVQTKENNQVVETTFISWNNGDNPLGRGVILIEEENQIKYLLLESKYNLITFDKTPRTFAMAYPDFSNGQIIKLPKRIEEAIPGSTLVKYIDLGEVYPEDTLIMGKTTLFGLIISISDKTKVNESKVQMIDLGEKDILDNLKDNYALAIISKLKDRNII